jgi:hypothetical protein
MLGTDTVYLKQNSQPVDTPPHTEHINLILSQPVFPFYFLMLRA